MTPPRLPRRLTQWIAPADLRQALFDDLDEAFEDERQRRGRAAAELWYCRQVLGGLVPLVRIRAGRALAGSADRRRITIMPAVMTDVRYAIRLLVKAPGFTLPAVVTLALGIGANTAIFTVAWRLILQPLPYPSPDRLVQVWELFDNGSTNTVTPGNFTDWRTQARSFESIAAYSYFRGTTDLTGAGEPEQLEVRYVTEEYCRVFATVPLVGRGLDARDVAEEARTVVISESLWRRRFGADPGVLGRTVRLGDLPYQIVGVMPAAFQAAAGRVDVWAGMTIRPDYSGHRRAHYLGVVARLKPGVTVAQADDDVKRIAAEAARLYPESNGKLSATVRSLQEQRASSLRDGLVVLAGAAGVVLLIACANLASLQFVRGVARARELGVRVALGASRLRLIRQLLTESLLLSLGGTGLGVLVGSWLLHAVGRVAPDAVRRAIEAGPDFAVFGVGVTLAILSTLLSATMPAWRATGGAADQLRQRNWSGDRATSRIRTILVTAEIGLAIVLVIGASLLIMSLMRVLRVDPGFDPRGVLAFDVSLPQERYPEWIHRDRFFKTVFDELSAIPGVTAVCAINEIPFDAEGTMTYVPEGQSRAVGALPRNVTPGCFDVLKMRVIRGRGFRAHEPARVGIVTENFARSAWPGEGPIGLRVHLGTAAGDLIEIVGVVEDSLQRTLDGRPAPQFYEVMSAVSAFQPSRVLLRTAVAPESVAPAVRAAVRRTDPSQPVARLRSLETVVGASVLGRRFDLLLLSSFAIMSLVLAAVGIYGLLAQVVAQRTGEIGIRLALGATGSSVVRLVMRSAWLSVGCGAGLGLAGAAAASQLLRRFMFGVSPTDPRVYLAAAVGLASVALLAAWLPARRAARVNPTIALRR
jgi:putative ABC transport system permease protein